jgi:hypothetical protein
VKGNKRVANEATAGQILQRVLGREGGGGGGGGAAQKMRRFAVLVGKKMHDCPPLHLHLHRHAHHPHKRNGPNLKEMSRDGHKGRLRSG